MQGAILYGPRDVRFEERDAPTIAMSSHESRQKLAREFGATDIVTERGDEGVARIKELTNGIGADAVLECVGTQESMMQAISSTCPGGSAGYVGLSERGGWPASKRKVQTGKFTGLTVPNCWSTRATATCRSRSCIETSRQGPPLGRLQLVFSTRGSDQNNPTLKTGKPTMVGTIPHRSLALVLLKID